MGSPELPKTEFGIHSHSPRLPADRSSDISLMLIQK
jgi:hypothetical protein